MLQEKKKSVVGHFQAPDSTVRGLVATIAFSLGVSISNIRHVIHWGLPASILDYVQEIGRAGRDGHPATATLFLAPHCKSQDTMRDVLKDSTCVRRNLLSHLYGGTKAVLDNYCGGKRCCSRCNPQC